LRKAFEAHLSWHDGCGDRPIHRKTAKRFKQENYHVEVSFPWRRDCYRNSEHRCARHCARQCRSSCLQDGRRAAGLCRAHSACRGYACGAPIAPIYRAAVIAPAATVRHVGYTRVTPWGIRHVGWTRVWR